MTVTSAAYPMVEEGQATARVAAVYAEMLAGMPMVPSLFKSLALCPPYLVMAWRQASPLLDGGQAEAAGSTLASRVREVTPPPPNAAVREELGRFVGPLGRMLFLASGLRLALEGELGADPASAEITPQDSAPEPERDVPAATAVDDSQVLGAIRSRLSTPIINSLWRHLAGLDLLAPAWEHLAPHTPGAIEAGPQVGDHARTLATDARWRVAASPAALAAAGCPDAAPGMLAVLDGYLLTLPRVLALVAGCTKDTTH